MEIEEDGYSDLRNSTNSEELFQGERDGEHGIKEALSGPSITEAEVENAIRLSNKEKPLDSTE